MIQPNARLTSSVAELLSHNPLFVFALDVEATHEFSEFNPLLVGVGKVNAAYHLTRRIMTDKPGLIVNLGSAGSSTFSRGEIVCCTRFIQRDMDVTGLGVAKYATPFSEIGPVLEYGLRVENLPEGICGTGDSFEMAHLSTDYNVVDMEAYPMAYIARQEQIPFLCLKYISDGADGSAASDWLEEVHRAAEALRKTIDGLRQAA